MERVGVAEARSRITRAVSGPVRAELPIGQAANRVLAEPLVAAFDLPRYPSAATSGYAVRAGDVAAASAATPADLKLIATSEAASSGAAVGPMQCARVSDGAALPPGADAVVCVDPIGGAAADRVELQVAVPLGQHVCQQAEEVSRGEPVMPEGTRLGAAELGVLAGFGLATVAVFRRPRVAICVVGPRLRCPGQPLAPGAVYDATTAVLTELAGIDASVVDTRLVTDPTPMLEKSLVEMLDRSDVVVVAGAIVADRRDPIELLERLDLRPLVCGVAQQPGAALLAAATRDGDKLVFGLPVPPMAALICFAEYVRPTLLRWQGQAVPPQLPAVLSAAYPRDPVRHGFLLGKLRLMPGGLELTPAARPAAHMLTGGVDANGIGQIDPGLDPLDAGDTVYVRMLPGASLQRGDR